MALLSRLVPAFAQKIFVPKVAPSAAQRPSAAIDHFKAIKRAHVLMELQDWRIGQVRAFSAQAKACTAQGQRREAKIARQKARLARGYLAALTSDLEALSNGMLRR